MTKCDKTIDWVGGEFKVGDKVVYKTLPHKRLFSVRFVGGDEIVVYELWDEMGAKTFTEVYPYHDIRHATLEEIAAGYRIDDSLEILRTVDIPLTAIVIEK